MAKQIIKIKKTTIDELTKELNKLKVSGDDPIKQKELQNKLDYFNYGIK